MRLICPFAKERFDGMAANGLSEPALQDKLQCYYASPACGRGALNTRRVRMLIDQRGCGQPPLRTLHTPSFDLRVGIGSGSRGLADPEHGGVAYGASAACGGTAVLECNLLRVVHFTRGAALQAICFHKSLQRSLSECPQIRFRRLRSTALAFSAQCGHPAQQ